MVADSATSAVDTTLPPVHLTSFGFLNGEPEADITLSMLFVKNPHNDPALRRMTGLDAEVQKEILQNADAYLLLVEFANMLSQVSQHSRRSWRVAIGCFKGRHRSVASVEILGSMLKDRGVPVIVRHRDLPQ